MPLTGSFGLVSMPVFSGPASTLKFAERAGVVQALDDRVEGRGHPVVDLDVAHRGRRGQHDRARFDALVRQALDQRLARDGCGGGVLAGVADAVAVQDGAVERVGGGDRDAGRFGGLDDVVVGPDLRRRHDDAVDGRVLHDLVQDLDLAGRVVGRRFRAQQQDVGADQVAGDLRAHIDRVEEAVAGGVGDDGEGELAVRRMEVLRAGGLVRRLRRSCSRRRLSRRCRIGRRRTGRQARDAAAHAASGTARIMFILPSTTCLVVAVQLSLQKPGSSRLQTSRPGVERILDGLAVDAAGSSRQARDRPISNGR